MNSQLQHDSVIREEIGMQIYCTLWLNQQGELAGMIPHCRACYDLQIQRNIRPECESCCTFQSKFKELQKSVQLVNEHKMAQEMESEELAELQKTYVALQKTFDDFKQRMTVEVTAEMGSSGALTEDINNPCRESELRKMYDKLRVSFYPEYLMEIKNRSSTEEIAAQKKRVPAMLKEVFTKAEVNMLKKKEDFLNDFKVTLKSSQEEFNRKQLKYIDLAVQNLQMIIFYGNATCYQTMYKELGYSEPDPLSQLADKCYHVGCLMALHNPPLQLDWESKERNEQSDIFPPIKSRETGIHSTETGIEKKLFNCEKKGCRTNQQLL